MYIADLHTHTRSLYDADIDASRILAKVKELGGKGIAITDHGSLSAIEDFRTACKEADLKLVPGCELYIQDALGRTHLVVLAKDIEGYHGIIKMVTETNRNLDGGFPVLTEKQVLSLAEKYRGHIVCLTACMQGVISSVFLQNDGVEKKVAKLKEKQSKFNAPNSPAVLNSNSAVASAEKNLYEVTLNRDETKKTSELKTTDLEKKLAKATGVEAEAITKAIADVKAQKEKALAKLPAAKDAVDAARKTLSEVRKVAKTVSESVEKWAALEGEIKELEALKKSEEDLMTTAVERTTRYQKAFGDDNLYMEVQYHGIPEEAECFPKVVEVAKRLGLPLVATNDVHFLENTEEERLKRQILRSLRFGTGFEEETVGDSELYVKTQEELAEMLTKILPAEAVKEAIANIEVVFDSCDVQFVKKEHYPKFSKTENANMLLVNAIREGAKMRFPEGMPKEYQERINYEYGIIKQMGYADYHLIVKDFLMYGKLLGYVPEDMIADAPLNIPDLEKFIKDNGWRNPGFYTGLGRGSAAGSLICYCLGITNIDPVKYGLLFERFLNPERQSLPDIDSDLSAAIRAKVIDYVKAKYGEDAVCGIMTLTKQAPKGSVNMAAKFYGFKIGINLLELARTITKDMPKDPNLKFSSLIDEAGNVVKEGGTPLYDYLYDKHTSKDAREVLKWAKIIEGSVTAYGAHAAGIVISDNEDVSDYVPLRMNTKLGMMTTQCNMGQVEDNGLLKMDFLGLTTLDIITETIRMIENNYGKIIDVLKDIPMDDKNVYEKIFSQGKTNAVFQFESNGMKQMLQRFKPETFEDLIILVSMFRPGPLQFIDGVIDVKSGAKKAEYACPQLEPILGKTYGAIVYQEQVMEIFQKLAGYSFGGADMVRRYMAKKKADKLAHEREAFVNGDTERGIAGCVANGVSAKVANDLFDQMMAFASYAFNKSHAACYAYAAYITAFLKYYYPAEFIAAALNWADLDDYRGLLYEAMSMGVKINAPDVNRSDRKFTASEKDIYFGLSSIRGVKDHANKIIKERENGAFTSLLDFYERVNPNSTVVTNLIDAGAFDEFCKNREAMHVYTNEIADLVKKICAKKSFIASAELVLPEIERSTDKAIVMMQEDACLKVEVDKATDTAKLQKRIDTAKSTLASLKSDLACVIFTHVAEQKDIRLKKEYDLLGAYVTEHPLNHYPARADIAPIDSLDEGDSRAYGIVTDLEIKKRRSDGQQFATFSVEDKSGSVKAVMFVRKYAEYASILKNGVVAIFDGECKQDGDEENSKLQFTVNSMSTVEPKKQELLMEISSYDEFKGDIEKTFREHFEVTSGGYLLSLFDKKAGKIIKTGYEVKENTKTLNCVREV